MTTTIEPTLIYIDGACSGNPGPGGYAAIIREGSSERTVSGGKSETTSNQMELSGAIAALKSLTQAPSTVRIVTDSQYVCKGITTWITGWKLRNWFNASGKAVKNADLWRELDELNDQHDVTWQWVKGHAGNELNERADALARKEAAMAIY